MSPAQTLATLSPKQLCVAHQLLEGKTNEEIAISLGLSVKTVKSHLTAIYKAVGCTNARQFLVRHFKGSSLCAK